MSTAIQHDWRKEFGLDSRRPPNLFISDKELTSSTPQAHLLRRAFDAFKVNGILCVDHAPLAYFKVIDRITPAAVFELHRRFWNHSGASLLVLITRDRVHVYSGTARPTPPDSTDADLPSLVTSLERVADVLQPFIVALESGEFFNRYKPAFDPTQRVDRDLLDNLRNTRTKLAAVNGDAIPGEVLDSLLCRLVFTCYLFDRKVIGENYLNSIGNRAVSDLRELLNNSSRTVSKDMLYRLFKALRRDFNGDLFNDDLDAEKKLVQPDHITILNDLFQGRNPVTGQGVLFWPYDFEFIPIETISAIYEQFLKEAEEERGAIYTPRFLAEIVLDTALEHMPASPTRCHRWRSSRPGPTGQYLAHRLF
jgi:hypothetical protein